MPTYILIWAFIIFRGYWTDVVYVQRSIFALQVYAAHKQTALDLCASGRSNRPCFNTMSGSCLFLWIITKTFVLMTSCKERGFLKVPKAEAAALSRHY